MNKKSNTGKLGLIKEILSKAEAEEYIDCDPTEQLGEDPKYSEFVSFLLNKKLLNKIEGNPGKYGVSMDGRSFIAELDEISEALM
jgi:hypothetical protein